MKLALELQSRKSELIQKQVRRLMHMMHRNALHAKKLTSVKHPENPVYPYLLKHKIIRYPNQVWISDLTYIKLPGFGYVYLVAIMDLYSRKVLSWRVLERLPYSILTKEVSSPQIPLPRFCRITESGSVWMVVAAGGTTSISNDSGGT